VTPRSPSQRDLAARADALRALHRPGRPLVLPNVWDAASAGVVAAAGFPALATSSAAVAASLGWADGEQLPPDEMFAAVGRVAHVSDLPLTADIESGYGLGAEQLVERLLAAGAVGCNLEDSDPSTGRLRPIEEQADRLARVREAATAAGVGLVLNARVDVFLPRVQGVEDRVGEAVRRGRRYLEAGADCVYPILAPLETLDGLVREIGGPVNAIATPDAAVIAALTATNVARISLAGSLFRAAQDQLRALVEGLEPQG
jgi:2-methylisocitrate lyase-like PEP mutase family enzyme